MRDRRLVVGFVGFVGLAVVAVGQTRLGFDVVRQRVVACDTSIRVEESSGQWLTLGGSGTGGAPQVVFDPVRGRFVLHDFGSVRAWNGGEWVLLASFVPRSRPQLAWDVVRDRLVIVDLGQTFEIDAANVVTGPFPNPPSLVGVESLAFDPATRRVLARASGNGAPGTFLWNGTAWTQVAPGQGPRGPVRWMAGDPRRRRIVARTSDETWEWDGATWRRRQAGALPLGEITGMVFDPRRGTCVLYPWPGTAASGALGWTGSAWVSIAPAAWPPPRFATAMVYDAARDECVTFGGGAGSFGGRLDDTWLWNGTRWRQAAPPVRPAARDRHALAYDGANRRVVLFGGLDAQNALLGDTWLWDGATWTLAATSGPSPRADAAFTFDATNGSCLLFGGAGGGTPAELGDTWSWSGTAWTQRSSPLAPPPRRGGALAHDAGRARTVLAGGTAAGVSRSDTWEWDGQAWQDRGAAPPVRIETMVFHPGFARVLGGTSGNSTVEWDGAAWRVGASIALLLGPFDSRRGCLAVPTLGRVWYPDGVQAYVRPSFAGCTDGNGLPAMTTLGSPVLGEPLFRVETTAAAAGAPTMLGVATTTAAVPVGGGCEWQLGPAVSGLQLADGSGRATWPLPVPNLVALVGLELHAQAATLDPNVPRGFGTTNPLQLVVGVN